jgi:tetratricopeptide (TPR) repeat protein
VAATALPLEASISRFDPDPLTTGTGLTVAALLPAALHLVRRGAALQTRHVAVLALPLVVALLALGSSDVLEARRAVLQALVLGAGFVLGASCDARGRRALAAGLAAAGLVHAGLALAGALVGEWHGLAGRLGNVGPTNQVALAGGLVGLWLAAREAGPLRWLGFAAATAFVLHAVLAPVLSGLLAAAAVLAVAALVAPWPNVGRARPGVASGVLVALFAGVAAFGPAGGEGVVPASPAADATSTHDSHLGGAAVRLLVWRTLPGMVADGGAFGRGPGQFAAAYPPYRDPREARASGLDTQVEHPHDDWLLVWVEYGWLGGAAATLLLALALHTTLRGLRDQDVASAALAAGGFGLLVAAVAHGALLGNPSSGLAAALCVGALRGARAAAPGAAPLPARAAPAVVLALALVPASVSWRHGQALADATRVLAHAQGAPLDEARALAVVAALERALAAEPRSPLANDVLCTSALAYVAADVERERWLAIAADASQRRLAARPHAPGAWISHGLVALLGGATSDARAAWRRALELAPGHPVARENLARLELTRGDAALAVDLLAGLDGAARRELVRSALRTGLEPHRAALALTLDPLAPSAIHEEGLARGDELAQGLAHHLWARQFLDQNDVESAVRSLRQAVRAYANDGVEAALARIELAGAEWMVGRVEAARTQLAAVPDLDPHAPPLAVHVVLAQAVRDAAQ